VIEINMSHPIYGNETFTLHGNVVMPQVWDDVAYPLIIDFGIEEGEYVSVPYSRDASDSTLLNISGPITVLEESQLRIYSPSEDFIISSAVIGPEQIHEVEDNMIRYPLYPDYSDYIIVSVTMNHRQFGERVFSMVIETVPDQTDMPVTLSFGGPGMAMEEYQPIYYYIEGYGEEYEGVISFGVDSPYQQPNLRIMPNKYSIVSLIYEVNGSPIEIAPGNAENGLLLQDIVTVNEYTNYLLTVQDNDTLEQKIYKIDGLFYTSL